MKSIEPARHRRNPAACPRRSDCQPSFRCSSQGRADTLPAGKAPPCRTHLSVCATVDKSFAGHSRRPVLIPIPAATPPFRRCTAERRRHKRRPFQGRRSFPVPPEAQGKRDRQSLTEHWLTCSRPSEWLRRVFQHPPCRESDRRKDLLHRQVQQEFQPCSKAAPVDCCGQRQAQLEWRGKSQRHLPSAIRSSYRCLCRSSQGLVDRNIVLPETAASGIRSSGRQRPAAGISGWPQTSSPPQMPNPSAAAKRVAHRIQQSHPPGQEMPSPLETSPRSSADPPSLWPPAPSRRVRRSLFLQRTAPEV